MIIKIKEPIDSYQERIGAFNLDKRKGFLDSSIWHYYVPMQDFSDMKFNERLKHVIDSIRTNNKLGLYDAVVSKEFVEFQCRLMLNSYLRKIGGGHEQHVTPFVFHSEAEMTYRANVKMKELNEYNSIEWRVLVVDDFANEKLKDGRGESIGSTKIDVIEQIIREIKSENNFKFEIVGTSENVVESLKEHLKVNFYDVVLLDYLLKVKNDKKGTLDPFLSSNLFTEEQYKDLTKHKGPLGKFWILPITSFSKAMIDKITNEGITRIHDDWYLFDGANPIATPGLFKYTFVKLLELQLKFAILSKSEILKFLSNTFIEEACDVRLKARGSYGAFMHKFGLREHLKIDANKKSKFADSVISYVDKYKKSDTELYEYIRKLLYLVGFGTKNDSQKIWNLLKLIDTKLIESEKKKIKNFFSNIVEYLNLINTH